MKFIDIKKYLHDKIPNLSQIHGWTIGMSNDFIIGIDKTSFFYPDTDNTNSYLELVERIRKIKDLLNN